MVKTVYIIRHAEAEQNAFRDFDRNLTGKGISQSARLGKHCKEREMDIQHFISSPANRAFQTAKIFMEQYKLDQELIENNENLYGGGAKAYLSCLNAISNDVDSVAIYGHNPDISFFAEYLTRDDVGAGMKKASLIILEFTDLSWHEISGNSGDFLERIDVKSLL